MPTDDQWEPFVRSVMPNASEEEIAEAVQRWASFMRTINSISERLEKEGKQ